MSTPLAAATKAASAAEAAEQQEVKRFVLEYGEREDEEAAHRQVADLFPAGASVQRGRGGAVRRVIHLSGGTASRIASSPDSGRGGAAAGAPHASSPPPRGGGGGGGSGHGGGGGYRGRGRIYHPKS